FENVAAVWRSYSEAGASAFVVSGLRALREDVRACSASVPGSVATVVVLTVTAEEQRERILGRTNTEYAAVAHPHRRLRRSNKSWPQHGRNLNTRPTRSRMRSCSTRSVSRWSR